MHAEFGNAVEPSWSPRKTPPQATPGDHSIAACMRFIHQQLDCFGPDRLLLGRYQLLGKKERRTGGTLTPSFRPPFANYSPKLPEYTFVSHNLANTLTCMEYKAGRHAPLPPR